MSAYWLTFKPKEESPERGWPLSELRALIGRVAADPNAPESTEWWRCANGHAHVGDRVYLFKQGTRSPRGIIGVGEIVGGPERRSAPTDPKTVPRANIRFYRLVDPTAGFLLPLAEIEKFVPQTLIRANSSGTRISDDVAAELERRLVPALLARTPPANREDLDKPA